VRPSFELKDSHSICATVSECNGQSKIIVTGGRDGMINVRSVEATPGRDPYECTMAFSAHAVSVGGVSSLALDPTGSFVFSAAMDGTIMIHSLNG